MTRTNSLTRAIVELLRLHGWRAWRNQAGMVRVGNGMVRLGETGSSDIMALDRHGRFVAVEVKTGRDAMRPSQLQYKLDIERRGCLYIVAREIGDVMRLIEEGK